MDEKEKLLLQKDYAFVVNLLGQRNTLIAELQQEIERLRTVEQAYQALLSATAGQQK